MRLFHQIAVLSSCIVVFAACGSGSESGSAGGNHDGAAGANATGGNGGASSGGSGGTSTGGSGGTSTGGSGGTSTGGSGGTSTGGGSGSSGSAGAAGGDASAGAAGTSSGGSAGSGTGGSAGSGTGGSAGSGTGGSAGSGTGGSAGSGTGGSAGSGTGGSAGSGTGGSAGSGTGGSAGSGTGGSAGAAGGGSTCTINADCDDGVFCNGAETCDNGACVAGTAPACDDNITCTNDFCDESAAKCQHVPQDAACSDGKFCNGSESCNPSDSGADPSTGCVAGVAPVCNDGLSCTTDSCDDNSHACVFTPDNSKCSDNLYCNGVEVCNPASGAAGTGCAAGTPVNCADSFPCTTDSCNETTDSCDNAPDNSKCNDGLLCNGTETCVVGAGCQAGTAVTCVDDGIACTIEACDPTNGTCKTTLDNSKCGSGQFCTVSGCVTGTQCTTNAQCDDGIACNGAETCDMTTNPGHCKPGTPVNCNDFIQCTSDQCHEPASSGGQATCSHTPVNANCDNGDVCDGAETCQVGVGCVAGTPLSCDDGVACTDDSCSPSFGCEHVPDNALCQDNLACNGTEICDKVQGCKAGTPPNCPSDGIACTSDVCVEPLGCTHVPNNGSCGCGQTCDTQNGCGNYCQVATCQGKTYQCGNCVDDDGDCAIDSVDTNCIGACDNNESGYLGNIPGQNNAPCKEDCYFDQDTGAGNDDCYWSHSCDPNEVAPNYYPYGNKCSYDANANIPGTSQSCSQLFTTQSATCGSYCGPLTPNGCDCFGCCVFPGVATPVFLGSLDSTGKVGTCDIDHVNDPTKCKPCEQVQACLNTCDHCELCLGKTTLPPDCTVQQCPSGVAACGLPGQPICPSGYYCVTGCCQPVAQ